MVNEYVRDEYEQVTPGTRVLDSEGNEMGLVGGTYDNLIEVRGGDQVTSYWIRRDEFGESTREAMLLRFPGPEIDQYAQPVPEQVRETAVETGALHDQTVEQREVMLQQMAEQRQEMRESGRATDEAYDTVGEPVEEELERRGVS